MGEWSSHRSPEQAPVTPPRPSRDTSVEPLPWGLPPSRARPSRLRALLRRGLRSSVESCLRGWGWEGIWSRRLTRLLGGAIERESAVEANTVGSVVRLATGDPAQFGPLQLGGLRCRGVEGRALGSRGGARPGGGCAQALVLQRARPGCVNTG